MTDQVSPIVRDVFDRLIHEGGYKPYAQDSFARAACPYQGMETPRAPGGKVYTGVADVTSTRIMGVDPGFPQPRPQDVPQAMINANIKSFTDGLRLAYPDAALRAYFLETLEKPSFHNLPVDSVGMLAENMDDMLPRILDKPPVTGKRDFRISLEHDIRKAIDGSESMLESRRDRRHLSDRDLLETYSFIAKHPEHWAGFLLWQNTIESYSNEMCTLMQNHYNAHRTEARMAAFTYYQDELTDFLPLAHTVFFTRDSIGIPTIPLFFIAAAKSLTPCRHAEPTPEDYDNGISMAQRAGIFRRTFDSLFGQRTVVCPFSGAGVKWLKMDLSEEQDSRNSAITACIQKIRTEKESSKRVSRVCEAIEGAMEKVMTRSSTSRMDAIEEQAGTRPACPYKKHMP